MSREEVRETVNEGGKEVGGKARRVSWLSRLGDVLLLLVILLALFALVLSIVAKKDSDGAATLFGYQLRFVQSASMEACPETDASEYEIGSIPVKSCVFIETVPTDPVEREAWLSALEVGDVLTFKYVYTRQETVTHRIVRIEEKATGGYLITLMGDNRADESALMTQTLDTSKEDSPNYIIGKVTGQSYVLGLCVYALKSPVGLLTLIIFPCLVIIILEILRIVRAVGGEKRRAQHLEREAQANEIEELRRRLALLEKENENKSESANTSESANESASE